MDLMERIESVFPRETEIPAAYAWPSPMDQREYLIQGKLHLWEGLQREIYSPVCVERNGELSQHLLGSMPMLTEKEALLALDAACQAYDRGNGAWPTMSVEDRIRHVETFIEAVKEKRNDVVLGLVWEIGKTLTDSEKEFDRTVDYLLKTVDALKDLERASSGFAAEGGVVGQIRRAPLGVTLCMGPFNYPLNETFTTLIPSLIMGNCAVFKPAKMGALLLRPLLEAFRDCFPPGVVNAIYGDGGRIIGPIMETGRVDCLAFIGSTRVADLLKKQHPQPHRLRSVLGLGAKNAGIVLPSADLDVAVRECVLGSLSFNGQRCTALKILFVHRDVADEFVSRFVSQVEDLPFGMPWEDRVQITPLPETGKPRELAEWVEEAEDAGAKVVNACGGIRHYTYLHPAVLYPVPPCTRIYHNEQFGPVVPISSFSDIEEPIRYILDSPYGQQVSLFGTDSKELSRWIDPLVNQVCRVNINSQCQRGPDSFPFTGRKDSAEGTLSVSDALRVFSIEALVAAKETGQNKKILGEIVKEGFSNFLSKDSPSTSIQ